MKTRQIEKADFDQIVEVIDHWWGGPISTFAHPIFFYELGAEALVAEVDGQMIGFLLGFIADRPHGRGGVQIDAGPAANPVSALAAAVGRTGYVHLVGIHPEYRRRGVGRLLYHQFTGACRAAGCDGMKAITTIGNEGSLRFHLAVGWSATEDDNYAGSARKRVVFTRDLHSGRVSPVPRTELVAAAKRDEG
jgi:GNAT superfamily N-acetyltransferase